MLRSGLFFAGADRVREGMAPEAGVDDGVLTAFEASQLNLEGTELVVLSACETGLGKELNSDGVFGLRRGLQEAGADAVMMSMWSVPDKETEELMALFYKNWLGGLEKPEALAAGAVAGARNGEAALREGSAFLLGRIRDGEPLARPEGKRRREDREVDKFTTSVTEPQ